MTGHEWPTRDELDAAPTSRGGVMIVDDEALLLEVMSLILTEAGYEVFSARDGFEAVALYGRHASRIRAVVLDLSMPHTRGEVVLSMLREMAPTLPILVSTGSPAQHVLESRPVGEASIGYLMKPYAPAALLAELERLIQTGGARAAGV
jgi:CheY-like chemotaxis protein